MRKERDIQEELEQAIRSEKWKDFGYHIDQLHATPIGKGDWVLKGVEFLFLIKKQLELMGSDFSATLCISLMSRTTPTPLADELIAGALHDKMNNAPPNIYIHPPKDQSWNENYEKMKDVLIVFDMNIRINALYEQRYDKQDGEYMRSLFIRA